MTRIALATAAELPDLDPEAQLLLTALQDLGAEALPAIWDADLDWASFDLVVVRNTWDYIDRLDEFLAWAHRVESTTRLLNRAEVIEWNTDKRYLQELAQAGVPVVPTQFIAPGESVEHRYLGQEHVVKPTVSAGSRNTLRIAPDQQQRSRDHITAIHELGSHAMVQPYLEAVDTAGETAMLFLDGRFSHAMRKGALLPRDMELVEGLFKQEEMRPREAQQAELDVAQQVLAVLPAHLREGLLYARVDVLPSPTGPQLLELELTEPSLFLDYYPDLIEGFAAAILARAEA